MFPEENLLATAEEGYGYFVTRPGFKLKGGRYTIVRKLGRGEYSSVYLVYDEEEKEYMAAKVLTVTATKANDDGILNELECLQIIADRANQYEMNLRLFDHFFQGGPHGVHLCLLRFASTLADPTGTGFFTTGHVGDLRDLQRPQYLAKNLKETSFGIREKSPTVCSPKRQAPPQKAIITTVFGTDAHRLCTSSPTGTLPFYIVGKILSDVITGVDEFHGAGIIHADIKADNIWIQALFNMHIAPIIAAEPPKIAGSLKINEEEYPVLLSQPLESSFTWDTPLDMADLIDAVLGDLGSALLDDQPKPSSEIGAYALRAPESVIGAYEKFGTPLDIWAIGCLTYELLTGKCLFNPKNGDGYTKDECHIALMLAMTGEQFPMSLIENTDKKDIYFDESADPLTTGNFRKVGLIPTPKETIEELLRMHASLTAMHLRKAASFIRTCISLNPDDRPTSRQLIAQEFMEYANCPAADPENYPKDL
ncbi:hypothetical protein FRC17_002779 [Serendipita sp. 399]|nr:hypothetical protein FRC17_002779 [Serendipita sp. 399]